MQENLPPDPVVFCAKRLHVGLSEIRGPKHVSHGEDCGFCDPIVIKHVEQLAGCEGWKASPGCLLKQVMSTLAENVRVMVNGDRCRVRHAFVA